MYGLASKTGNEQVKSFYIIGNTRTQRNLSIG